MQRTCGGAGRTGRAGTGGVSRKRAGEETVVVEAYIVQPDWSDAWDVMEARFEEQYPWIDVEIGRYGRERVWTLSRPVHP